MSGHPPRQASGFSTLAVRTATAAVYAAVVLAAIIWGGPLGLGFVVMGLGFMAAIEFYAITRREHRLPNELFGLTAIVAMPLAAAQWGQTGLMAVVTALVILSLVWHVALQRVRTSDTAVTVFGAIYLGFMLSHLVLIRQFDSGTELALATVIGVWVNDVFAYLVGVSFGRHKMAPTISPHKSWEGFVGGTLATIGVWAAVYPLIDTELSFAWHLIIGVAASLAAVVGDLAESRIKREAGVKDSGTLLPGHGGFLDRIDSLIFVSVVVYYLLVFGGAR